MDLLADIVEKEVDYPQVPTIPMATNASGFPTPLKSTKISSWKTRLAKKKMLQSDFSLQPAEPEQPPNPARKKLDYANMSEAEKIHYENIETLSKMSPEEAAREKAELMESLDPKILTALLKRSQRNSKNDGMTGDGVAEIAGPGTWIGGTHEEEFLPKLDDKAVDAALGIQNVEQEKPDSEKKVRFDDVNTVQFFNHKESVESVEQHDEWEDIEHHNDEIVFEDDDPLDHDDLAPQEYQLLEKIDHMTNEEILADVHFVHPVQEDFEELDINDPDFQSKLHDKYFPNLPKDTAELKWMEPVPNMDASNMVFSEVSEIRFDFQGNLVSPSKDVDTNQGLHHHSEQPGLAGYTLVELAHLARSSMPSQRCIAIQTLGRILHKLGKQLYSQLVPEVDQEVYEEEGSVDAITNKIYAMFWALVKDLRITETLEEASDEKVTKNLSVRNYAIEALWLWKQGGGNVKE